MCCELPKDLEDLYDIIGSRLSDKYGSYFLHVISCFLKGEDYVEVEVSTPRQVIQNFDIEIISDDDEYENQKPDFDAEFDDLDDLILQEEEDEALEASKPRYSSLVSPASPEVPRYFSKNSRKSNVDSEWTVSPDEMSNLLDLDDFQMPSARKRSCSRISERFQMD
jgi:hypothetical protein